MPDIGVVAALPRELATLGAGAGRAGSFHRADGWCAAVSGIGAERAQAAASRLLEAGVVGLVSWGTAGGLRDAFRPGDVLLAERVAWPGDAVTVDAAWRARLAQGMHAAGLDALAGTLWCHAHAVTSIVEKQELAKYGYDAVDMESAGVARAARAAGVPFVSVKAVCDPAARALPPEALDWLRPDGRVRPGALARSLARDPHVWRALREMRRDFNAACAGLRRTADVLRASWPA